MNSLMNDLTKLLQKHNAQIFADESGKVHLLQWDKNLNKYIRTTVNRLTSNTCVDNF